MKILFTGGSGFVGRNVIIELRKKYEVLAPSRAELNLKDYNFLEKYIGENKFDVVIHSANPNPLKNQNDMHEKMFEDSIRIFTNLYKLRNRYGKMIYLGSGAECDKRNDLVQIKEDGIHSIPQDVYGFAKYIMNELSQKSSNIYNLRLFACYGPFDHKSKFITHAIRCCLKNESVSIRQNCIFDYLHVFDLEKILEFFIENTPQYQDYNICSGKQITLQELAENVCKQMGNEKPIIIAVKGWNKEYTADNTRLLMELHPGFEFMDIDAGIEMQIQHERERR